MLHVFHRGIYREKEKITKRGPMKISNEKAICTDVREWIKRDKQMEMGQKESFFWHSSSPLTRWSRENCITLWLFPCKDEHRLPWTCLQMISFIASFDPWDWRNRRERKRPFAFPFKEKYRGRKETWKSLRCKGSLCPFYSSFEGQGLFFVSQVLTVAELKWEKECKKRSFFVILVLFLFFAKEGGERVKQFSRHHSLRKEKESNRWRKH